MNRRPEIPWRVMERAIAAVDLVDGHLISRYSISSSGYPQIGWWAEGKSHMVLVHQAAWEQANGRVPAGMTVDHVCKEKRCAFVGHLRLLTNSENGRRHSGRDWPLGECARGHAEKHRVRRARGTRCLLCEREDQRAYRTRRAAA